MGTYIDTNSLRSQFRAIGAELDLQVIPPLPENPRLRDWRQPVPPKDVSVNVVNDRFLIRLNEASDVELLAPSVRADLRHLLLVARVRRDDGGFDKPRFLAGHDERHWFVAGVRGPASNVEQAMESLKPAVAAESQRALGVRGKLLQRRRNPGFVRQGEWFFVPAPEIVVDPRLILRDEPLNRAGGKPHRVEELYRVGGETVYVSRLHREGLTEAERDVLFSRDPSAARWDWSVMRRNPAVFARGKVRHADHATITLRGWHRVAMNEEEFRGERVAFLD